MPAETGGVSYLEAIAGALVSEMDADPDVFLIGEDAGQFGSALNLRGLARAIRTVAEASNGGALAPDDLAGSTFTITNPGPYGGYASVPIINQPNSAILSVNKVSRRPTAVGDAVAVHHMTILGFSYDHRAFDGVTASRFLSHLRDALQDRDWEAELGQIP